MRWHRINALIIRHLYLFRRSFPRLMDIFYWPVMELVLWGFISVYLTRLDLGGFNAVTFLLGAVIFWDILFNAQKAVSIAFLEEVWERNFLNIFVTPLTVSEFIVSTLIVAVIRISIIGVLMSALAFLFYQFNVFLFGVALVPFMLSLLFFGSLLGLFTTAIILRYGTSAQVLAFGFLFLIQPFSAVFYPVSVLPEALQYVAYLLPSTYVFEGMRAVIQTGILPFDVLFYSFGLNLVYAVCITWFFYRMFAYVKREGKLLKLEG